jgi:hypothetical protein
MYNQRYINRDISYGGYHQAHAWEGYNNFCDIFKGNMKHISDFAKHEKHCHPPSERLDIDKSNHGTCFNKHSDRTNCDSKKSQNDNENRFVFEDVSVSHISLDDISVQPIDLDSTEASDDSTSMILGLDLPMYIDCFPIDNNNWDEI